MVNRNFRLKILASIQNCNKSNGRFLSEYKKRIYFYRDSAFYVTQLLVSLAKEMHVIRKKKRNEVDTQMHRRAHTIGSLITFCI